MGVKSKVSYFYLVCEVCNPGLKGCNVVLKALNIGIAWDDVEGGADVVKYFSMYRFTSSLSEIHLHTSMMTCVFFVFIS